MPKSVRRNRKTLVIVSAIAIVALISIGAVLSQQKSTSSTETTTQSSKPVILYVNQGNALVSTKNYSALLNFAKAQGFNTIFFQVYRSGNLLFSASNLTYFADTAHLEKLKIFFALYFTGQNQLIPASIYGLGEDGISLDMSALSSTVQSNLLGTLKQNYKAGLSAVTSTNLTTTLHPDMLILETYQVQNSSSDAFIHPGIIASVEPLAMQSESAYSSQYRYDLHNSDGVMVFDYYGLLKTGYQS